MKSFKKLNLLFVYFFVFILLLNPSVGRAGLLSPQLKAVVTMSVYGTIGGALLGAAGVLAFQHNERIIAQGASLGLYSGIFFGSYILGSYALKNRKSVPDGKEYYPDAPVGPYGEGNMDSGKYYYHTESVNGASFEEEGTRGCYFNHTLEKKRPLLYINLLYYTF